MFGDNITLREFNSLNDLQKIEALGDYGELVSHRFDGGFKFMLYQINNFYVELKYITEGNVFINFNSFQATENLESYLKEINIDGIKPCL